MAKALYRKWRPQNWDEVVAQEHIIQTLRNAVANDRVAHAYLFAGPRGTGKTTTARLLAKAMNCLEPNLANRPCNQCEHCLALNAGRFMDLIEIDAASNTSVDDVRDLREKINFSPSQGKYKVYIIDEVHMLSTAAFNALLKTLEEPPPHAIFILATTEIHKIPATVLSRCQQHEFRRIPIKVIVEHLKNKCDEEAIKVEEGVFTIIARQATGSLRDAISLLDQLTSTQDMITLEVAQTVLGTATSQSVIDIVDAVIAKDSARGLSLINQSLDSGTDPRQLARQLVTYLRNILLEKMGNEEQFDEAENILKKIKEHASKIETSDLLRSIEAFNQATSNEQANWHPGLGLELAFTSYLTEPQPGPQTKFEKTTTKVAAVPEQTPKPSASTETKSKTISEKEPLKIKEEQPEPLPQEEIKATKNQEAEPQAEEKESKTDKQKPDPLEEPQPQIKADVQQKTQPDDAITITQVQQAWSKIKAMVGAHNRRTAGLLNSSKLAGLKENTLFLGFVSDTLKEMMEKEGNIVLTSDILEEVFGQPIIVKCIVTSSQSGSLPENIKIEEDGMVGTATRDLGGKISSAEEIS